MRRAVVGLILASFLAPLARFQPAMPTLEACACPPVKCLCSGHGHASGHAVMCAMSQGGRCSIESSDAHLSQLGKQSLYIPVDLRFVPRLSALHLSPSLGWMSRQRGFARLDDPPPRMNS
jgi:hypothetical protein